MIDQKLALAALEVADNPLSPREVEMLQRYAGGAGASEIAAAMSTGSRPSSARASTLSSAATSAVSGSARTADARAIARVTAGERSCHSCPARILSYVA